MGSVASGRSLSPDARTVRESSSRRSESRPSSPTPLFVSAPECSSSRTERRSPPSFPMTVLELHRRERRGSCRRIRKKGTRRRRYSRCSFQDRRSRPLGSLQGEEGEAKVLKRSRAHDLNQRLAPPKREKTSCKNKNLRGSCSTFIKHVL